MTKNTSVLTQFLIEDVTPEADTRNGRDAWESLARVACKTATSGLVLEQAKLQECNIPTDVRIKLQASAFATSAYNSHLASETERAVSALNGAGIPVMLLKGMALLHTAYEKAEFRPMSDVDLIVRTDDAMAAVETLFQAGFRQGLQLINDRFFPEFYHEVEVLSAGDQAARFDLHAKPLRPMRFAQGMPKDALWENALPIKVGGAKAFVPCPEHMLIHLAAHAAIHGCSRWIWLFDLKHLTDRLGSLMDWPLFLESTQRWGLSLPVHEAITIAQEDFGPFVPEHVMATLRSHRVCWQDRLALRQAPRDAENTAVQVAVNLATTPGIRYRLRYLMALLSPSNDHLEEIYPHRHLGWTVTANLVRTLRIVYRLLAIPLRVAFARSNAPPTPNPIPT